MSTSPTDQDINAMDINDLRQLLKDHSACIKAQAVHITIIEKEKADADITLLAQTTNTFSPAPAVNLSASINAAAPMDEQQVTAICDKLLSQMETRLIAAFLRSSTQQSPQQYSSSSAAPSGPQIPTGLLPGAFSPPNLKSSQRMSSSAPSSGTSTSNISTVTTTALNDYDKAVEVDQRKLRDPDLTPTAIRKWKLT